MVFFFFFKSPESKLEIHKLTVFELEVIFQLLNNHSVRLAHLLPPLIFTAQIRDNNLIIFIAVHMQKQTANAQNGVQTAVYRTIFEFYHFHSLTVSVLF